MESRGHRVKIKKESAIKELLKINNFILGNLLKAERGSRNPRSNFRSDYRRGREMSLLFNLKKIILENHRDE